MDIPDLAFSRSLVAFISILNPFALALYLSGLMDELERKKFFSILFQASMISLAILFVYGWWGDSLVIRCLVVQPAA